MFFAHKYMNAGKILYDIDYRSDKETRTYISCVRKKILAEPKTCKAPPTTFNLQRQKRRTKLINKMKMNMHNTFVDLNTNNIVVVESCKKKPAQKKKRKKKKTAKRKHKYA